MLCDGGGHQRTNLHVSINTKYLAWVDPKREKEEMVARGWRMRGTREKLLNGTEFYFPVKAAVLCKMSLDCLI